ncbi:MAG: response regulator transcription factor [Campylobacterota bacterium]|nr:response regulator transcription factor [Campylobacterota bacterium]
MSFKILLLEDDLLFGETLQDFLEEEGCEITLCRNGEEALETIYANRFDLYLLDINVPLIDGLTLLSELRSANDITPAIYLTSYNDKETLAKAFENGGDDYLKKPFDMDELLLRIHALMRRAQGERKLCIKELCIDDKYKRVMYKEQELRLATKEYQLLRLLMRHVGEVVTKEMIIEALWNASQSVSDGAIRVYINRLKHELDDFSIENIRGVGYRFVS